MDGEHSGRKNRKPERAALITVVVIAAVVVADLVASIVLGVHLNGAVAGPSSREAAQQLKTQPHWKLLRDESTDHPDYCLIIACSETVQEWNIGYNPLDCSELQALLRDSGYNVVTHRNNYTPEANRELKNCGSGLTKSIVAEATTGAGRLNVRAAVTPSDSFLDGYELHLRIAR